MMNVFLDAVFKPFFKIVHDTGQQLTIDRASFLTDGFISIFQRRGFVSVNTRFQIPPERKKSHVERSGELGGHGTYPKREMRCPGNMFRTVDIDWCAVCAVAPSCWNYTLAQFVLLQRSSEYYPFKRCQVPVGHTVRSVSFSVCGIIHSDHAGWREGWLMVQTEMCSHKKHLTVQGRPSQ